VGIEELTILERCDVVGRVLPASGCREAVDCAGVREEPCPVPFVVDGVVLGGGLAEPWPCAGIGCCRFVERLRISLPCTTMLSFDFFRSLVSISVKLLACDDRHYKPGIGVIRLLSVSDRHAASQSDLVHSEIPAASTIELAINMSETKANVRDVLSMVDSRILLPVGLKKLWHTITAGVQVNNVPYPDIDDAEEALVLLLELLLVKYLNRQHAVFRNSPAGQFSM
jgi:hypothetical protein